MKRNIKSKISFGKIGTGIRSLCGGAIDQFGEVFKSAVLLKNPFSKLMEGLETFLNKTLKTIDSQPKKTPPNRNIRAKAFTEEQIKGLPKSKTLKRLESIHKTLIEQEKEREKSH